MEKVFGEIFAPGRYKIRLLQLLVLCALNLPASGNKAEVEDLYSAAHAVYRPCNDRFTLQCPESTSQREGLQMPGSRSGKGFLNYANICSVWSFPNYANIGIV